MRVDQPGLVMVHRGVAVLELDLAGASGLHLGAGQHQAGLAPFHQEIVVSSLAVVAENFKVGFFGGQILPSTLGSRKSSINLMPEDHPAGTHLNIALRAGREDRKTCLFSIVS